MGEDSRIVAVPGDEDMEIAHGVEHEGVGGEPAEFGEALIDGEGDPLAGAVEC